MRYQKSISGEVIDIDDSLRAVVGRALLTSFLEMQLRVLATSVADRHAHVVVELPVALATVRRIAGDAPSRILRLRAQPRGFQPDFA